MAPSDLVSILELYIGDEQNYYRHNASSGFWRWGWIQQRERLAAVARQCVTDYEGDIVEIGCQEGLTTKLLCRVARQYNRRVIAIDPWQIGTQACEGGEYEKFLVNIEPYKDIVDILRLPSQDIAVAEYFTDKKLCFAYVDGLHTNIACTSDIRTVSHARCIAVDDILWSGDLLMAYMDSLKSSFHVRHPYCREGYILNVSR